MTAEHEGLAVLGVYAATEPGCWSAGLSCGPTHSDRGQVDGTFRLAASRLVELERASRDDYGRTLHDGFSDEIRTALAEARGRFSGLLRLRIEVLDPVLSRLRWEYLQVRCGSEWQPVGLHRALTFARRVKGNQAYAVAPTPFRQARTLLAICSPLPHPELDVARFTDLAREAPGVERLADRQCSLDRIVGTLQQARFEILIVLAHGSDTFEGTVNLGAPLVAVRNVVLSNQGHEPVVVPMTEFVTKLATVTQLPRLVVLVVCRAGVTGPAAWSDLGASVVGKLGIAAAITMAGDFTVESAASWLPALLHELATSGDIDVAAAAARRAILGRPDALVPVLSLRTRSHQLFRIAPERAREPPAIERASAITADVRSSTAPSAPSRPVFGAGLVARQARGRGRRHREAWLVAIGLVAVVLLGIAPWRGGAAAHAPSIAWDDAGPDPIVRGIAFERVPPPPPPRPVADCPERLARAASVTARKEALVFCSRTTSRARICPILTASDAPIWAASAAEVEPLAPYLLPCFPQAGIDALDRRYGASSPSACPFLIEARRECTSRLGERACAVIEARAKQIGCLRSTAALTLLATGDVDLFIDNKLQPPNQRIDLEFSGTPKPFELLAVWKDGEARLSRTITLIDRSDTVYYVARIDAKLEGAGKIASETAQPARCDRACSFADLLLPDQATRLSLEVDEGEKAWSGDRCRGSGPCAIPAARTAAVSASFERWPELTIEPGTGGTIEELVGAMHRPARSGRRKPDTEVVLTHKAEAEAVHFKTWGDACSHAQDVCRFKMPAAPAKVSARFVDIVRLSIAVDPDAAGRLRAPVQELDRGDAATVVVTPEAGWQLKGWTSIPRLDELSCDAQLESRQVCRKFVATRSSAITVIFERAPPISIVTSGQSAVTTGAAATAPASEPAPEKRVQLPAHPPGSGAQPDSGSNVTPDGPGSAGSAR